MNSPSDKVTRACPNCGQDVHATRAHIADTVRRHIDRGCQPFQHKGNRGNFAAANQASAKSATERMAERVAAAGIDVEHNERDWVARWNERPDLWEALLDAMFAAQNPQTRKKAS